MSDNSTLPCMNCQAVVGTAAGKFFAEVFVCANCHEMCVHFYQRLERELKGLLTMSQEAIRIALVKGQFHFPEGPRGELSKREVLETALGLEAQREKAMQKTGAG